MIIVDTHCHVSRHWYEPVARLLEQMDHNQVAHAVLVQMMGEYDNSYQEECVRQYPDRLASVVLVDTARPDAPDTLEKLVERGAAGVRLSANTRSPGDVPFAIWRKAEALNLTITCAGSGDGFISDAFKEVLQTVSQVPIIIEHLGSGNKPDGEAAPYVKSQKIFALSRFPNTYIKIHGLGEFCQRAMPATEPFPFERPIPPLLNLAYDTFGPERMMWGSDYPPVSGREGYSNALQLTLDQFADKPEQERAAIFGGVAMKLYGFH